MSTTYGAGDGSTSFNVPDATGRALVGKDSTQSEFDTLGETGGSSSVTLTTANLPAHDHSFSVSITANTSEYATTSFMRLVGVSGTSSYFNHMPGYAGGGYADYGDTQFPQHFHSWSASASSTTSSTGSSGAHNNLQPYIALTPLVSVSQTAVLQPGMVLASSDSGSVPSGWSLADGSAISRTSNASLFTVSGTSFGSGDGSTTFNSPNLKGRTPVGVSSSQTAFDALGETGGAKSHTLVSAEMPSHNHNISLTASGNTSETPRSSSMRSVAQVGTWMNSTHMVGWDGGGYADSSGPFPQHAHSINVTTSATSGNTGGSTSHNELQPYKAVRYLVATSSAPLLSSGMLLNVASSASTPAAYSTDMAGRVGVGVDSTQTEFDLLGETGGTKTESLTIAQMPTHSHSASLNFTGSTSESATASWNRITQQPGVNQCCDHRPGYSPGYYEDYSGAFPQHYHAITISASGSTSPAVGSGTAHQNLQPYLVTQVWSYSGSGSTSASSYFAAASGRSDGSQSPPYGPLVIAASAFAWISIKKRPRAIPGTIYAA
jgi:microcystin-dependent protein